VGQKRCREGSVGKKQIKISNFEDLGLDERIILK